MNLSTEQLAEFLAGIVRSQQAVIDAIESQNAGFRNTHLLPKLNTASNMRLANARLLDIPSRVLLRSQGRQVMDVPTIVRALEEALGSAPAKVAIPSGAATSAAALAPVAATGAVAAAGSAGDAGSADLDNFFDS